MGWLRRKLVRYKGAMPAVSPSCAELMPKDLQDVLEHLEKWAVENRREACKNTCFFWALKIPAILASASTGVWAYFGSVTVTVISGAIASACIAIDGFHPRGMLRNTHLGAFHDIRMLSHRILDEWRSRSRSAEVEATARQLIKLAAQKKQEIAARIRDAETALKGRDSETGGCSSGSSTT